MLLSISEGGTGAPILGFRYNEALGGCLADANVDVKPLAATVGVAEAAPSAVFEDLVLFGEVESVMCLCSIAGISLGRSGSTMAVA